MLRTQIITYIGIYLYVLLFPSSGYAQRHLQFNKISVEHGLSQSSVYSIFQDKSDFIWFATGDGLNRFDGKDFTTYKSRLSDMNRHSLKQRNINSNIVEDNYNRLWASCDAGIFFLNKKYGTSQMVIPYEQIKHAPHIDFVDERDSLWASIDHVGLIVIDTRSLKYHTYRADSANAPAHIMTAFQASGNIFIADVNGLISFDKHTHHFSRILQLGSTECAHLLHDGRLLIGGINCAYMYDLLTGKHEKITLSDPSGVEDYYWESFAEHTPTNTIYLGSYTNGTLCALNLTTMQHSIYKWQKNNITNLMIDRSENLWIGTDGGGAYKADLKPVKFYCYPEKKHNDDVSDTGWMVKSIYTDDNKIWVGTYNKGLIIYDLKSKKQEQVKLGTFINENTPQVNFVTKDSSGDMIVTAFNHILWLDERTKKIKKQLVLPSTLHPNTGAPGIYYILEWKKGQYICCTNEQLFIINTINGQPQARGAQHIYSWQYRIGRVKDGTFYITGREGYQHIKIVNDTILQVLDKDLYDIGIRDVYESATHPFLFMASESGLIVKNEKTRKYIVFDERHGLGNSYVYSVLPENDTSLWLSTNAGITNARIQYTTDSVVARFINYTTKDGLQSNEFNTGAYYKSTDGTLYFGGIYGINWFNPKDLQPNPYKAKPIIAAIEINDNPYAKDTASYVHDLVLPYNNNTITLSFKALEYTDPGSNSFAYQLKGIDERWIINQTGHVRYTNLPPGHYTFLLKASNNDGVWNEQALQLSITIQPPYWRTWWFRALCLIFLVAVVYVVNRYYIRIKLREKTLMLEKQQALYEERLRISKDVHDDLGSGLSKITLMAEAAKRSKNKTEEPIEHISRISKDLIGNMRDLIWVLNPENTTLDNLAARIREYCGDYLEGLTVDLITHFPEQIPAIPISREAQKNIFFIVKEAVHNAVKHAAATEINICLQLQNEHLLITINDNGKGFHPGELKRAGNGLRNMKLRMQDIGGDLDIASQTNRGTTIKIDIALKAITNPEEK